MTEASLFYDVCLFAITGMGCFLLGRPFLKRSVGKEATAAGLPQPRWGTWTASWAGFLPATAKKRERLQKDLLLAGNHRSTALSEFLAMRNACLTAVVVLSASGLAWGVADERELPWMIGSGVAMIVTYASPHLWLSAAADRRKRRIERSIPDALDLMAISVSSGAPLPVALHLVVAQCADAHPALSAELRIVARQTESRSLAMAFGGFAKRMDLPEVAAWCELMQQSHRLGGRLADALVDYGQRIRDDRQHRLERSGSTASIKLLLPVVLCLTPPIAIVLVGPAILDLREFIQRDRSPPPPTVAAGAIPGA